MAVHEFWFVGGGKRTEVRPMQAVRKAQAGEWRKVAEYPVEAGSVVVHEFDKKSA